MNTRKGQRHKAKNVKRQKKKLDEKTEISQCTVNNGLDLGSGRKNSSCEGWGAVQVEKERS